MVTIIDYGIGNLRSVEKALEHVGVQVLRTDCPETIASSQRLVLPGVGAFGACIDEVRRLDLEQPILDAVNQLTPILGVCVGMQMLFDTSEERGEHRGLGLLGGRIVRFEHSCKDGTRLKVPHMGWNALNPRKPSFLLQGIETGAFCYFAHSYYAAPQTADCVVATTRYGPNFPAIVSSGNVHGMQFHPEKSHRNGLKMLKNFATCPVGP